MHTSQEGGNFKGSRISKRFLSFSLENTLPDISGLPGPTSRHEKSPAFKRGLISGLLGCGVGRD